MPITASAPGVLPSRLTLLSKGTITITGNGAGQTIATIPYPAISPGDIIEIFLIGKTTLGAGTPNTGIGSLVLAHTSTFTGKYEIGQDPESTTAATGRAQNISATSATFKSSNDAIDLSAAGNLTLSTNPAAGTNIKFNWIAHHRK